VNEPPPAELLARLRPIPTYRDHPATVPHDIVGVDPSGEPVQVQLEGAAGPVLLLFLSSSCAGCQDLWEGVPELGSLVPGGVRIIVVTRDPDAEDASAVAALAPAGTEVVMSSSAYADHLVTGPPFLVVVAQARVVTESVAWGVEETARTIRTVLEGGRQ
jgi:hypothetical protein